MQNIPSLEFLQEIKASHLDVVIKCDLREVNHAFAFGLPLQIFIKSVGELKLHGTVLSNLRPSDVLVIELNRATNLTLIADMIGASLWGRVFVAVSPYNPADEASLSVVEVAACIADVQHRYPEFRIRPLPLYEPMDPNVAADVELEPLLTEPAFAFNTELPLKPLVSFVIPTCNNKYFLVNVVRHLLNQKFDARNFEILIIDDGGTDDTKGFLQAFLKEQDFKISLRYFYWPKCPAKYFRAGQCRNLGANHAQGDHLVFLDSDMLLPENFLEDLSQKVRSFDVIQYVRHHLPVRNSHMGVSVHQENISSAVYIEEGDYWGPFFATTDWESLPDYWKYTCSYCLSVRRDDFFAVGRFRRSFLSYGFEDTDLGFRLHKGRRRFHLAPLVLYHLTPKESFSKKRFFGAHRFMALSKTAKKFYLLNLDESIYKTLRPFMGGELSFKKTLGHYFGKILNR